MALRPIRPKVFLESPNIANSKLQHSITREALLRPLGNVTYFMPPYVISEDEIRHLATVATEGIDKATRD